MWYSREWSALEKSKFMKRMFWSILGVCFSVMVLVILSLIIPGKVSKTQELIEVYRKIKITHKVNPNDVVEMLCTPKGLFDETVSCTYILVFYKEKTMTTVTETVKCDSNHCEVVKSNKREMNII